MASPTKGELFLGLSSSELKLICLGVLYNDAGKVCPYSHYLVFTHIVLYFFLYNQNHHCWI